MRFSSAQDAANKLLEVLPKTELEDGNFTMVCLSLDAVIIADIMASKLNMNYDLLFSEPILAPNNPECEIAAVSETEEIVMNDALIRAFEIAPEFIYGQAHRIFEEKILKNVYKYRKGKLLENLKDKNVLLVDEGCQTGLTLMVAVKTLMTLGVKSVFYAAPVMPADILVYINSLVDSVFCANKVVDFVDVDFYYEEKIDKNVNLEILQKSPYYLPTKK